MTRRNILNCMHVIYGGQKPTIREKKKQQTGLSSLEMLNTNINKH